MAITVFLGVEREKISQYVLEKLLLFFFSVSDPVSLRMKARPGRGGEGAAAAAWSDPSSLPAETPFQLLLGWQRRWALPPRLRPPGRCKEHLGTRASRAPGVPVVSALCPPPRGTALLPSLAARATSDLVPLPKCWNSDNLVIFLQSAKSQWNNHKTCSKGHILWAVLFVCWPSSELSPALISGDLFLQPARWFPARAVGSPCCPCPSHRRVPACRLRPRDPCLPRELPRSSFPAG